MNGNRFSRRVWSWLDDRVEDQKVRQWVIEGSAAGWFGGYEIVFSYGGTFSTFGGLSGRPTNGILAPMFNSAGGINVGFKPQILRDNNSNHPFLPIPLHTCSGPHLIS